MEIMEHLVEPARPFTKPDVPRTEFRNERPCSCRRRWRVMRESALPSQYLTNNHSMLKDASAARGTRVVPLEQTLVAPVRPKSTPRPRAPPHPHPAPVLAGYQPGS